MSESRLEHLEARFAWLERHVQEQDRVVADLNEELLRLRREIAGLRERLRAGDAGSEEGSEPPPPHY